MAVQIREMLDEGALLIIIIGKDEITKSTVQLKHVETKQQIEIPREYLFDERDLPAPNNNIFFNHFIYISCIRIKGAFP